MKNLFLTLGSVILSVLPMTPNEASAPLPESCTVGTRPFTRPLNEIGFYFDGGIKLLDGASAVVKCNGETVAVASRMEVSNYTNDRTQGSLAIYFETQNLPKGKDYTLCVAPGSIAFETDGAENQEFSQTFSVPENLGPARFDVKNGAIIDKTPRYGSLLTCYWKIETEPVGDPVFLLYREDKLVREFPASIGWDWDLGQAYPMIDEELRFEKGVSYSLVLPAGSAHAMYRDDIVNEEAVFNYTGGYEETVSPLNYVWCSLYTNHSDVLDIVSFTYDRPVRVAEGAKLQLWENDGEKLVKEADAYLDIQANCWIVSADFGGFQMAPGVGYVFVIPEGAIIAENGDPVVNSRNVIKLNGSSGIDKTNNDKTDNASQLYDLGGRIVAKPAKSGIYIQNGRKIVIR